MDFKLNPIIKELFLIIGKFFLFTIITIFIGSSFMLLAVLAGHKETFLTALTSELTLETINYQTVYYIGIAIGQIAAIYVIFKMIEQRTTFFNMKPLDQKLNQFLIGCIWGIGLISSVFGILWAIGSVQVVQFNWDGTMLLKYFLFFFYVALVEELIFRTFTISLIGPVFGQKTALILSAFLFTYVHHSNPSYDIIPFLNILLGGLVLGLLYIKYDQIWCPLGFHLTWNFFQGNIFGFEVSGLASSSIIEISKSDNTLLTGGDFGLEGSIFSVIALFLVLIVYRKDWVSLKDNRKVGYLQRHGK